jgi:hypothetical protein
MQAADQSVAEKQAADQSVAEKQVADQSVAEKQVAEKQAGGGRLRVWAVIRLTRLAPAKPHATNPL